MNETNEQIKIYEYKCILKAQKEDWGWGKGLTIELQNCINNRIDDRIMNNGINDQIINRTK